MRQVDHFIVGGSDGASGRRHQIWNPSTGEIQAEVHLGNPKLLDKAVSAAKGYNQNGRQPIHKSALA